MDWSLKLYGSRTAEITRLFDDVRVTCAYHVMRAVSSAMKIYITRKCISEASYLFNNHKVCRLLQVVRQDHPWCQLMSDALDDGKRRFDSTTYYFVQIMYY